MPVTHFWVHFGTLAARCKNSKELQWFGAVLGTPFRFLGATGALLTPEGSPGTGKVVGDLKKLFLVPRDASDPTGQEIEAAFPMICAWVPQGTHESKILSNFQIVVRGNIFGKSLRELTFRVPGGAFRKHNENPCF